MIWIPTTLSLVLFAVNYQWWMDTRSMKRTVPGSLPHLYFKRRCRMLRYPGFAFWPTNVFLNLWWMVNDASGPVSRGFHLLFAAVGVWMVCVEWKVLIEQIEDDDDDDPWNKAKAGMKKAANAVKKAAASLAPGPAPAGGAA